jgi:hypothetical protein
MEMPCRLTICKVVMAHSTNAVYVLCMQIQLSCQMGTQIAVQPNFIVENEHYMTWVSCCKEDLMEKPCLQLGSKNYKDYST